MISLLKLPNKEKGKIKQINIEGPIKNRLLDLGLIDGTIIEKVYQSPFGDPIAYLVRGTVIALREEISSMILVEEVIM
jgi:ferrous iron transport protein A